MRQIKDVAASPGAISGTTICRISWRNPAPSTRAASNRSRNLEQEGAQEPDAQWQVDGGVDEDQGEDVVQELQVARQQVQRNQAGRKGQEARRDEEEQRVLSPLHRPDRERVGGRQPKRQDEESRDHAGDGRVDEERRKVAREDLLKFLERRRKEDGGRG